MYLRAAAPLYFVACMYCTCVLLCDLTVLPYCCPTCQVLHVLRGHEGAVQCVALLPDSPAAVSGASSHELVVWDVYTGRALQVRSMLLNRSTAGTLAARCRCVACCSTAGFAMATPCRAVLLYYCTAQLPGLQWSHLVGLYYCTAQLLGLQWPHLVGLYFFCVCDCRV